MLRKKRTWPSAEEERGWRENKCARRPVKTGGRAGDRSKVQTVKG